ncbi:MAG: hypothetical protein ACRC3Y_13820 [Romboutsia sp.]|uniref:hypothetical protein n=1 Tax=Romboutsia sp. TaxID=1965302 RepID=UPI003F2D4B51
MYTTPNPCCKPIVSPCSCKEGVICALHWLWDRFHEGTLLTLTITSGIDVSNILEINNITTDVTSVQTSTVPTIITKFISLCTIDYLTFTTTGDVAIVSSIKNQFNNICYTNTSSYCCKNGVIDAVISAKKHIQTGTTSTTINIAFKNATAITVNDVLAINNDTVWCRNISGSNQTFYVVSICQISSVTLN